MRLLFSAALLFATMSILSASASAQPFAGTYSGTIAGSAATLVLQQQGTALQGTVDAEGYGYTLAANAAGNGASGTLHDPQTGSSLPCEIALDDAALTLTLVTTDMQGQAQRIPFSFTKGGAAPPSPQPSPNYAPQPGQASPYPDYASPPPQAPPPGYAPPPAQAPQGPYGQGQYGQTPQGQYGQSPQGQYAQPEGQRDPALFGQWVQSDTYTSGEFSGTTRTYAQFNPDGTLLYGGGGVTAGMGGMSGQSSGGDVAQGQWRTEGNLLYGRGPNAAWSLLGRYYIEGQRMLITAPDGSREFWSR